MPETYFVAKPELQAQILGMLNQGITQHAIARKLRKSVGTIGYHVRVLRESGAYTGKAEHKRRYFRVAVTYIDGETSANRVFKERSKAKKFAEQQKKSPVVKKVSVKIFVREQYPRRHS
ncbi:MAG TPA: winged helix-turn-helix domain-containing protein [Candidatus Acidoferrum sp.]|jgi:predicted transcriptional regulator